MQMLRGEITIKEWLFYTKSQTYWKQIWIEDKPKEKIESGVSFEDMTVGEDFEGRVGEDYENVTVGEQF